MKVFDRDWLDPIAKPLERGPVNPSRKLSSQDS